MFTVGVSRTEKTMTKTTEDDGATKQKVVEQEKKIAQLNYLLSERETQIAELTQLLEQLQ